MLNEKDQFSKFAGYGFDASIVEIMPCFMAGSCLHILEKSIKLDIQKLNKYLENNNITISFALYLIPQYSLTYIICSKPEFVFSLDTGTLTIFLFNIFAIAVAVDVLAVPGPPSNKYDNFLFIPCLA